MRRRGRRKGAAVGIGCLAALSLLAGASSASAVTIGQIAPGPPDSRCEGQFDLVQPTVTDGNSYVVPSTGGVTSWTVTSWSTNATADAGQTMGLKIFRKVVHPATFMAISHGGRHNLSAGLNTFTANLVVRPGDLLGANWSGPDGACAFQAPPAEDLFFLPGSDLADGVSATFELEPADRLNASAEITPTSDFTLGKLKRKSNGTAVLTVNVPNPGALKVAGKGVKGASAGAVAAKQVPAGTAKLVLRAKGKKKAKLADTGKVTVKPKISFTPTGGTVSIESRKVKLRRK
jgi:hypothetical protein